MPVHERFGGREKCGLRFDVSPTPYIRVHGGSHHERSARFSIVPARPVCDSRSCDAADLRHDNWTALMRIVHTSDWHLGTLHGLQEHGRMVGVITHVEAMKERLHPGIVVERRPDGRGSELTVNP